MGKRFIKILKNIIEYVLDIIYPPESQCIYCYKEDYIGLCPQCLTKIKRVNDENEIKSFAYYNGVVKKLILELKYKNNFYQQKF
ncbi:ComF family protein [Clostridium chauvoei]|uniref:Amidophosphoribosyltransferase n=1 Tax=Clostridium chauvoei JF4335 TaxID=1351755 RepID=A0A1U6JQ37_9CLOT|nr:hypothetical protein [Clostridium chauvoei]SLK22153.1 amidophosphoribosyltransferase [Clostridium chauvoei JF4335]